MFYLGVDIFGAVLFRGRYIRYSVISHLQPKAIRLTGLGMVGLKREPKDRAPAAVQRCARKSTEFASGSKIVGENRVEMENSLVTQDSPHRGFC